MLQEIILALVQAATEFLPVSSSGHLALLSNLINEPNLFFFTTLHLASLVAVLIFTRKEIKELLTFSDKAKKTWVYLIIGTIPAGLAGLLFNEIIESAFTSYLILAITFAITGTILLLTKFTYNHSKLNTKNSLYIGIAQILALFPGISRSGTTISTAMYLGIPPKSAAKFSFLLYIPLALGAFVLELIKSPYSIQSIPYSYILPFIICMAASLLFLNILMKIITAKKFHLFAWYCYALSIISLILYFT